MSLLDGARERAERDDGAVVALIREVSVSRELARRVDSLPLGSNSFAVVVYDPDADTIESVQAPLGFTQAKEAYRDARQ